jgi:hypothetical protein
MNYRMSESDLRIHLHKQHHRKVNIVPVESSAYLKKTSFSKQSNTRFLQENRYAKALAILAKNPHLRSGIKNGKKVGNANYEHYEQVELFNWIYETQQEYILDFYAVANGGIRPGFSGANLKDEGVTSGQPDVNCDLPRGNYHGLRIEMKWGDNKPSKEQKVIMNRRVLNGYFCALCYSSIEGTEVIDEYLSLKNGEAMVWCKNEDAWREQE